MAISSLEGLFVHTLRDIYFAENHQMKKLPLLSQQTPNKELKAVFDGHLAETRDHIGRLDTIFGALGQSATATDSAAVIDSPAIKGITKEAEQLIAAIDDENTRDAALIAAAQALEHYEITRYGTLIAWARRLGHEEAAELMRITLAEEKAVDSKLLRLGWDKLNQKAA